MTTTKMKLKNDFSVSVLISVLLAIAFFAFTAISVQAACGDGTLDSGEVCDGGNFMNDSDGNPISTCSDLGDTDPATKGNALVCVAGGCTIDQTASGCSGGFQSPEKPSNVPESFDQAVINATNWILGFVIMIAVLAIVWGGIQYLTSAGNEDQARSGKKTIQYALTGLVIAGLAYAIINIIVGTIFV